MPVELLDPNKKAPKPRYAIVRPRHAGRRNVAGRYDAAQLGTDNRRHWAGADRLDAVRSNTASVRARVRSHARYEVANNSYAKGIIETLANDVIGIGPTLQILTGDSELNERLERDFAAWARTVDLASKLRTMRMAKATDGETFLILFDNDSRSPVTLDLRLIEADQVDSPTLGTNDYTEGIKFDKNGQPEFYSVLSGHPGSQYTAIKSEPVAANYVIHWFRQDRPGQIRGMSEIVSALALFAQLRRYTLAVITSAELMAELTLFIKTTASAVGEAASVAHEEGATATNLMQIDIDRGLATFLPEGWEPEQIESKQPTATYEMFKREILNEIARCLNIPYNIAACNSSNYNYASGRLDHQTYYKAIRVEQDHCGTVVLDRILGAWLDEYAKVMRIALPNDRHQWFWTGNEHVDPAKEAIAQKTRLGSHTTTWAAEFAREGKDWRKEFAQIAEELDFMREHNIPLPLAKAPGPGGGGSSNPNDESEPDEEPESEDEE